MIAQDIDKPPCFQRILWLTRPSRHSIKPFANRQRFPGSKESLQLQRVTHAPNEQPYIVYITCNISHIYASDSSR